MPIFAPLNTTWFALIGLLWAGYFFLEGFDFGVAIVSPFVSRSETDRRICLNSVGPFWDGNEVWVLVAGGATFAAFPLWYARMFSGFYLALFLVLLALIVRGVSFEFRNKERSARWRRTWDVANLAGSFVAALVWGAAFANLAHGLPFFDGGHYDGGLIGLLHPIGLLGGLLAVALFAFHGALFLSLKTDGPLEQRARTVALWAGGFAFVLLAAVTGWVASAARPTLAGSLPGAVPLAFALGALVLVAAALGASAARRSGWAFAATGLAILLAVGAVFARLFPAVLRSNASASGSLTIGVASSHHYTLVVMTVVAAIFTPLVLAYQGWTYWVFRRRITAAPLPSAPAPEPGRRDGAHRRTRRRRPVATGG